MHLKLTRHCEPTILQKKTTTTSHWGSSVGGRADGVCGLAFKACVVDGAHHPPQVPPAEGEMWVEKSSEMGFLLTESVALEAPRGPTGCAEGPWLWAQQRTLGWSVTMRVRLLCAVGDEAEVWMMGPSGGGRGGSGILGLKRSQEMEEENQAQWPRAEECAGVWADSRGL